VSWNVLVKSERRGDDGQACPPTLAGRDPHTCTDTERAMGTPAVAAIVAA